MNQETPTACDGPAGIWPSLFAAAATTPVDRALRDLYTWLDDQVRRRGPTCWTSGKCCNFDQYDHLLYVTALEIAWVLRQDVVTSSPVPAESSLVVLNASLPGACEFQRDKLCTIHGVRPMGCRVFFCQRGTQDWQQDLYENALAKLRAMHEQFDLPYRYLEWRAGLREARLAGENASCR